MPEPFLCEIRIFAGNFAPAGWAFCDGQILPISQNIALFSILGTRFGGDGQVTFALPDLRGRVPIQPGQGNGLSLRNLGESGGAETHALAVTEMPAHTHAMRAGAANGASDDPTGRVLARAPSAIPEFGPGADSDLSPEAVQSSGNSVPHDNMQPYLVVNYIIAMQGVYPPQ